MSKPGGYINRDRLWHPPVLTPDYKSSLTRSPKAPLLSLPTSISEETGPVFGHGIINELDNDLTLNFSPTGDPAIGPRMIVHGRVLDEHGRPVPDALIEIWQANAGGRYRHSKETYVAPLDVNFGGCGRTITGKDGSYEFLTIRPGPYPWPNTMNDWRPAHIHFSLFGAAFAQRLITQMYFEGDPLVALCPMANGIPDDAARARLLAPLDRNASLPMDCLAYRFDLVLRGRRQTAFENRKDGL